MSARAIVTSAPESERAALGELRGPGVQAIGRSGVQAEPKRTSRLLNRLAPGVLLIELPGSFEELAASWRRQPPIFIRHVQPVDREVPVGGGTDALDRLVEAALELAPRLERERSFSVQTRLISAADALSRRFEINERLAAELQEVTGSPLDVRAPEQVVSVLVTASAAYMGLSRVEDNLSAWAGGAIRFAREPEQVSRSEFKLLEALVVFGLSLPAAGSALDLGASPGGWTRLLRRAGMAVTAVDPGDLDPRLTGDPGIRHVRATAQEYRCRHGEFGMIVNDMRMDARDSARLMLDYASCLTLEGRAIMTLKLPQQAPEQVAHQAIGLLMRRYTLVGARQLFHNRSEITVALRRADAQQAESRSERPDSEGSAKARKGAKAR